MLEIVHITPDFAVTGALEPQDFAAVAAQGFKAVLNNRPESEEEGQLTSATEAELAWRAGLRYRFMPLDKHELFTNPVVEDMVATLGELDGPVLAHCKSGLRSAIVWAAANARSVPVNDVLAALDKAGLELDFLRDDLDAQADHACWVVQPAVHADATDQSATSASLVAA